MGGSLRGGVVKRVLQAGKMRPEGQVTPAG